MEHSMNTPEGRDWLKSHLRMGPVKVTFTKKDGTERVMNCSLQEGVVVPHEKTTDRVKEDNLETLAVWDLDKSAWRSFRLDSIKSVEFTIE
jgi:WYL_2, Sm-like SH3 beta-barrel fold